MKINGNWFDCEQNETMMKQHNKLNKSRLYKKKLKISIVTTFISILENNNAILSFSYFESMIRIMIFDRSDYIKCIKNKSKID